MAIVICGYGIFRADGEEEKFGSVSDNGKFFICLCGMFLLCIILPFYFVYYDNPARTTHCLILPAVVALAWTASGVLCVANAFFWHTSLKTVGDLAHDAEDLVNGTTHESGAPAKSFADLVQAARKAAEKIEQLGPLSYFPMIAIMMLFLASSSWLDNWHLNIVMKLLLALKVIILVALPMLVQQRAKRFKKLLVEHLENERLKAFLSAPKNAEAGGSGANEKNESALGLLNRGCFAPLSQQPVLGALASLFGGSGLITLVQQLLPR
jgi:hypothetical protein